MVKPGFGIFQARRKSSGNAFEDADPAPAPAPYVNASPTTEQSTFRVLNRTDIERAKIEKQEQIARRAHEKSSSKLGRFSFGASGNKGRTQSIDEDSPSSSTSKRDSKSSSGTQSFTSRPSHAGHYGGSSSTLPSSAESDPTDTNLFSHLPARPQATQTNSSPSSLSLTAARKHLPPVPAPSRSYTQEDPTARRSRTLTTSSYASTAIPPKLDSDLDFGSSGFDDMFSSLDSKNSPEFIKSSPTQPGRSLLPGRRTFQAEPLTIDRKLDVEAPLKSWDSRGSTENLIASPSTEDRLSPPPPPVPRHKYTQYEPVASHSPELNGSGEFEDVDAKLVRQSAQLRKLQRENSPDQDRSYTSSSSATSLQTPLTSTSASSNTTPKAALRPMTTSPPLNDDDDNLFASPTTKQAPMRKPVPSAQKENVPPGEPARQRVMTAAEFQAHKERQMTQPVDESSEEEDYEDEEEAIRKREEEQKLVRQRQQLQIAREHMKRSTTAPMEATKNGLGIGPLSNGFPSETSLQADEWSDEDVPLGVLAQHGFPSRNKPPTQPPNATPSYFRSSTPNLPDRPASAGPMGNRTSGYRPPFARNLPDDPYALGGGNGLVRQPLREPMGFNRATSVYNEPMGGMPYDQPQFTSLVDQIQMRDNAKLKYNGGASSKKPLPGPFTGTLGGQMNAMHQNNTPNRMSQMPQTPMGPMGMGGMNPMMNPMMGGQMPMMGMNQMPFPMYPQNELMMQQMYQQMLQFQAQNGMFMAQQQQQSPHDSRMSVAGFPAQNTQNPNFLNAANAAPYGQSRPMSILSVNTNLQNRPFSTLGQPGMPQSAPSFMGAPMSNPMMSPGAPLNTGYTPSIAPSERSNIGLSARYRPVVTGNGLQSDNHSTVSSSMTTLQASGGAADANKGVIKGILKNKAKEDDEDDWGKMARRKMKFGKGKARKEEEEGGLQDLVRGVEGL